MSELQRRILAEVEGIPIVDTHEHTMPESERADFALDFSLLFAHYSSSDLVSAGMPPRLMEAVRLPMYRYRMLVNGRTKLARPVPKPEREDMSLAERWQAMKPYWEAIRNTAYARGVLIAANDIFGVDDLNDQTYERLSQAIADTRRPGWYRHVLKELARIELAIIDVQTTDVDRELFAPSLRLDHYVAVESRSDLVGLEEESGVRSEYRIMTILRGGLTEDELPVAQQEVISFFYGFE